MVDHFLEWMVVFLPLVFGFVVEVVGKNVKQGPYWRKGIFGFAIALSALIWWQQHRAHVAADNEKTKAEEQRKKADEEIADLRLKMIGSNALAANLLEIFGTRQQAFLSEISTKLKLPSSNRRVPSAPTNLYVEIEDPRPLTSLSTSEFQQDVFKFVEWMRSWEIGNAQAESSFLLTNRQALQSIAPQDRTTLLASQAVAMVERQTQFQSKFNNEFRQKALAYRDELLRRLGRQSEISNGRALEPASQIESDLVSLATQLR